MAAGTFVIGIVVALLAGASLAALWFRAQSATRAADRAAEATRPIAGTLERIESHMREIEAERRHMLGGLEQHLGSLSRETLALSQALRSPNARGRWGELTLRRVAELAGMAPYCDFEEQAASSGEGAQRQRPDMLVKLPGGRVLAVDAKVPLSAYLDAEAAADSSARDAALDRHAKQVAHHVNALSSREYWAQFQPAPEMVVLFLAGDHFLSAALEREPELLEHALAKRVLIATPITLVSVLKGVAYGWRQEKLARNADELRRIGAEFYDRLRAFAEAYADSGRHLTRALEAYNRSAGSWEARVLPSLRRMNELGSGGTAEPPALRKLDGAAREPHGIVPLAAEPQHVPGDKLPSA